MTMHFPFRIITVLDKRKRINFLLNNFITKTIILKKKVQWKKNIPIYG